MDSGRAMVRFAGRLGVTLNALPVLLSNALPYTKRDFNSTSGTEVLSRANRVRDKTVAFRKVRLLTKHTGAGWRDARRFGADGAAFNEWWNKVVFRSQPS